MFLGEVEGRIDAREDFAIETTLSGKSYLRLIERLRADGWTVVLHYIALPNAEVSKARVAERVQHGGHNIPEADIQRRFPRSLRNLFESYRMAVDKCFCYFNAGDMMTLVFEQAEAEPVIFDQGRYEQLARQGRAAI